MSEAYTGKCKECLYCKNKLLCVTSGDFMFTLFGDGCFNFEHQDGTFSRPKEMYKHLKDRFDGKTNNQYNDRMTRMAVARPPTNEYEKRARKEGII